MGPKIPEPPQTPQRPSPHEWKNPTIRPREPGPKAAPSDVPAVKAEGLWKSYQQERLDVPVLQGFTLTVASAEFVALTGPSGCGKTTAINCLSGLDDFDRGSVQIGKHRLERISEGERTRLRRETMGFVFQTFNLLPTLTAEQNVALPLLFAGWKGRAARQRAQQLLKDVDLADRTRHRPGQLSGGQQQRVAIARALANSPTIIWADEPTGNLDPDTGRQILQLFVRLNREQNVSLVVVTHSASVADAAHRVVRMESGRVHSTRGRAA